MTLGAESLNLIAEAAQWRLLALLFECPGDAWRQQVVALGAEAHAGEIQASEGVYLGLFGPGGPISLREVTYLGGVQLGYLMSELSACYDAFGYQPETAEPLDHLSVEVGFLSYLKLKQAYALACGDTEHAAIASEAAAHFTSEHLACIAEPLLRGLETLAPEYLVLAGRFLLEQVGPRPRNPYPLGDPEPDEITCGVHVGQVAQPAAGW
jgi:hypothetical protein